MVKFYISEPVDKSHAYSLLNVESKPSLKIDNIYNNNPNKNDNNNNNNPKYTKVVVENPYNNREIILRITKRQKGVYI